ncbi:hypothetical protein COL516b_004437 [Colletotrichum fioriniae]|nr:uncharacterized protein COL516b_004437 [Colletotrichum fioriniae]KAJ0306644.1 hypothetical protein COL516b_004437 [Colletotrichum fioriniae]
MPSPTEIPYLLSSGVRSAAARPGVVSITHPSTAMQQDLYRDLLAQTGIEAAQLGYVEIAWHCQQADDATNMSSVAAGFGSARSPGYSFYVGPVKANVGHARGRCGHGIPHQVHYDTQTPPDPRPDRIHVSEQSHVCRAARVGDGRKIKINNSDIAYSADTEVLKSGNVSLLLEEGSNLQQQYKHGDDGRKYRVAAVSAHTPPSPLP